MDLQEELIKCKNERQILETRIQELVKEIGKQIQHGDIIEDNSGWRNFVVRESYNSSKLLIISTSGCFDVGDINKYVKDFRYKKVGSWLNQVGWV